MDIVLFFSKKILFFFGVPYFFTVIFSSRPVQKWKDFSATFAPLEIRLPFLFNQPGGNRGLQGAMMPARLDTQYYLQWIGFWEQKNPMSLRERWEIFHSLKRTAFKPPGNNDDGWNILYTCSWKFPFWDFAYFHGRAGYVSFKEGNSNSGKFNIHTPRKMDSHGSCIRDSLLEKEKHRPKNRQHLQGCMVSLDLLVWLLKSKTITLHNHKSSLPSKWNTYLTLE